MALRKAAFLSVMAIALVAALRWTGPISASASAHTAPGTSLQAPGASAHTIWLVAPAMSGSPCQPVTTGDLQASGRGEAKWATQNNWEAAPSAERSPNLRQASPTGQPFQRGEYKSTDPNPAGPDPAGPAPRPKAALFLLSAAMIAAIIAVAGRSSEAAGAADQAEASARARAARRRISLRPEPQKPSDGCRHPLVKPGYLPFLAGDQIADWERVRLVPT